MVIRAGSGSSLSRTKASRFLTQATVGPTTHGIDHLVSIGNVDNWLTKQFSIPASYHLSLVKLSAPNGWDTQRARYPAWWQLALHADDQPRQRNEFKAYDKSVQTTQCLQGKTTRYHWYFRLADNFPVTPRFSHFMQIKAYDNAGGGLPIMTLTGYARSTSDQLEVRYFPLSGLPVQTLARTPLDVIRGQWLEVEVIVTCADDGYLRVVVRNDAGMPIINIENTLIDMWRGSAFFNRPKWGIYRSLIAFEYLVNEVDTVDFADFTIQKVELH